MEYLLQNGADVHAKDKSCHGGGPARGGGGGSHVTRLNFKTSRVGVYKCLTSLSEIERNFFVFVRIVEKGDGDAL